MVAGVFHAIGFLAGVLTAYEPIYPDHLVSISCPRSGPCLVLDEAGNLFALSQDPVPLQRRAFSARPDLRKMRFSGMVEGIAMDHRGMIWRTRNGGRSFELLPTPGSHPVTDFSLGENRSLWVALRNGTVANWTGSGWEDAGCPGSQPVAIEATTTGVAVLSETGEVYTRRPGTPWSTSKVLAERGTALSMGERGDMVVAGCGGQIAYRSDDQADWKPLPKPSTGWSGLCPTVARLLNGGEILIAGPQGLAALWQPGAAAWRELRLPLERGWHDAAEDDGRWMLVGEGGALALLERSAAGESISLRLLTRCRPATTDVRVFPGNRRALRAFGSGEIQASEDGGLSWQPVAQLPPGPVRTAFIDERTGYALSGHHRLFATSDGGRNWSPIGQWDDVALNDLAFPERKRGFVAGEQGFLGRTTDGGRTWTLDRLPSENQPLTRVQFVDPKRGWVVGGHQQVFATTDGGMTWERCLNGRGTLHAVFFLKTGEGWVGGDQGTILHTQDEGKSWTPRPAPTGDVIRALWFGSPQRGLAVDSGGRAFVTRDGGEHWVEFSLRTRAALLAAACWPNASCLLGGDRGMFWSGNPFGR